MIREGDLLLHHPYDSFQTTVERFIQTAAEDPDVLAIKLTLYRTGGDSSIARLLAQAAERGKQVAVLIELQARFDEENNIIWAQRLEDVGVHVSYGVAGLKTHAKVMLVVRREGDTMRRYLHIGTGNYNPKTARIYTDFGLLSASPDLGADLTDLFNVLTGFASPAGYRKLIVAPRGMRERFIGMIRREIAHRRAGAPARIIAKMNALVDPDIIAALYEASRAGVPIDLIVRGICCLRPGLPGVSDTIRVDQHRRPVPRALARVLLPERRRGGGLSSARRTGCRATSTGGSRPSPRSRIRPTGRRCATCSCSCGRTTARRGSSGPTGPTSSAARPVRRPSGRRTGC